MNMKRIIRVMGLTALSGCLLWGRPPSSMAGPTPERSMELFRATAAELDLGGDMFFYIEAENVIANVTGKIMELVNETAARAPELAEARMVLQRIRDFFEREGVNDLTAYGISSRPLGDGNYLLKSFLARRPISPAPRFWRMLGNEPRELAVLQTIPREAALFVALDLRPDDIWALIQAAAQDIWGEDAHKGLREMVAGLKTDGGFDLDAVISSLSGELAVSVLLDESKPVELPLGEEPITIPAPSAVIALGIKNDTLIKWFAGKIAEGEMPMEQKSILGVKVYIAPETEHQSFPFQLAATETDGFFIFATHGKALTAAISALRKGESALNHENVTRLLERLPRQNNGVTFVDERFNRALVAVQVAQMRDADDDMGGEIMKHIMGWFPQGSAVSVRIIKPHGIQTQTVGPMGGKETIMTMASIPIGVLAGIAIPTLIRSKAQAEHAVLINTLRMVDAAKEQWAMENNASDGAVVTEENILSYLKGGILLPPGHTLRINPIGESPVIITPDGTEITLP